MRRVALLLALLAGLLLTGSAHATGPQAISLGARSYTLVAPPQPAAAPALLIALHPFHFTAAQMQQWANLDAGAAALGDYVAYPQGIGDSWNAGACCGAARDGAVDDVGFLAQVIADAQARIGTPLAHVALVGMSNGGMMAYRFACERADLVDTIVVDAATFVANACPASRPLSILAIHGLADPWVPFAGSAVSALTPSHRLLPVASVIAGFARLDKCGGWTAAAANALVTRYAASCPAGTQVVLFTSKTLTHAWPTGALRQSTGLDASGLTWAFLLQHWNGR